MNNTTKTVMLPDGYNGGTITCDAEPIAIDGNLAKLAVMTTSGRYQPYMFRWIHVDDLKMTLLAQGVK